MAMYSEKFKMKIVREYIGGDLGYNLLAKKYSIPAESQVRRWVRAYKEFGEEGFQ